MGPIFIVEAIAEARYSCRRAPRLGTVFIVLRQENADTRIHLKVCTGILGGHIVFVKLLRMAG
jgi:hypothetical protein